MSGLIRLRLEPRTAIMAKAEVVWEDQLGARRGALAKIEDTSLSGACIRVSVPIGVGAKLKIKWHKEQFSGITKYCRRDGGDYVLGIQREKPENEARTTLLLHDEATRLPISSPSNVLDAPVRQEKIVQDVPKTSSEPEPAPIAIAAKTVTPPVTAEAVSNAPDPPARPEKIVQEVPNTRPEPEPAPIAIAAKTVTPPVAAEAASKVPDAPARPAKLLPEVPKTNPEPEPAPIAFAAKSVTPPVAAEATPKAAVEGEPANKSATAREPSPLHSQGSDTYRRNELRAQEPSPGQERTNVFNKLLHRGPERQQQNVPDVNSGNTKGVVSSTEAKPAREHPSSATTRVTGVPPNQGSLLALPDIYLAVGIMTTRIGYNIDSVSAMLDSEHLRGMTGEVKRASVLMALEAAGIPVDELMRDGAKRLDALNAYEAGERKRFEDYETRKSQESAQIQAETERMAAHCLDRIKHNLSEVTLAKDAFLNWQTTKQNETQRISDAVALFSKPRAVEQANESKPALQTVGAESK